MKFLPDWTKYKIKARLCIHVYLEDRDLDTCEIFKCGI